MKNLWTFLDGKKTVIGGMFLFAGTFLHEVVQGFWGVQDVWIEPMIQTLNWFGMVFTGVGITAKAVKQTQGKK